MQERQESVEAVINKIVPGGGNGECRTAACVILHGCALKCRYCLHPEKRVMCLHCGFCILHCPGRALSMRGGKVMHDTSRCLHCGRCIRICPFGSSPRTSLMSPEEVLSRIQTEIPSAGTILVSGGEYAWNVQFIQRLFMMARAEGYETEIDSSGMIPYRYYPDLARNTDAFQLSIASYDRKEYVRITGTENRMLFDNAAFLAGCGKLREVKSVIVPELYNTEASIAAIGRFLEPYQKICSFRIRLIPYRPAQDWPGRRCFAAPSRAYLLYLADILNRYGFQDTVLS